MSQQNFAAASQLFDKIITQYPNTPTIDNIRLMAGYAYYCAGDYDSAISHLKPEIAKDAHPDIRPTALLFTGLAQLSKAQKITDTSASDAIFTQAGATFTDLVATIAANPTPDNKAMREDAIYYRVLSEYQRLDYDDAIKDLLQLLQEYSGSLKRPDYNLLLGSFYAAQASQAVDNKKPPTGQALPADIMDLATKALDAFNQVSSDPNALVQANDANQRKAEVLFMIAPYGNGTDGYQRALEAFRLVRRKDDMIPLQQDRLQALKLQAQAQVSTSSASLINTFGLLIDREEGRLKQLQDGADPIIQALIRIAECYTSMHQGDEARTVLHRLAIVRASLTPDQQQEIDFQTIYSYVLGGQTAKADAALTDYLAKHPGDKQAQGISYQMAADLLKVKDYSGALAQAQRSVKDFPEGPYAADAINLQADALNGLNRPKEAQDVLNNYVSQHASSPVANRMLLTKGKSESEQGNFTDALTDYGRVKDNAAAGDLQPVAHASYIQALQALKRWDDVVTEVQAFAAKYPNDKNLASVLTLGGVALDMKHDPGAVAALQDVAKKYPQADSSPFALYYVVNIFQRAGQVPQMIQAAADLRTAYPTAYPLLSQAAEAVSTALIKAKKFDDALAEYQPLIGAPQADIASLAQNKTGDIWFASAKSMGAYGSLQPPGRDEVTKRLTSAETAYVTTLKNFSDNLPAVGDAFDGLIKCVLLTRSWGLVKDVGLEDALDKATADLSTPDMKARVELAKAGLAFVRKDGASLYSAALARMQKVVDANPTLALTRQEASQYGELLIASQQYPKALDVFNGLLSHAAANDQQTLADAYYGLGAAYLAQNDYANAKKNFTLMTGLKNGAAWHPHIMDAQYGIALADEQSTDPTDLATAKQTYALLMQTPQAGVLLQSKSMLGYGRVLEKMGNGVTPTSVGPSDVAVHYYTQIDVLFGPAVPEQSAEGLYLAGEAYKKAGDTANAQQAFTNLTTNYKTTAPDWANKAQ
jgi:tetratricopeptide (TPR) repeat protein